MNTEPLFCYLQRRRIQFFLLIPAALTEAARMFFLLRFWREDDKLSPDISFRIGGESVLFHLAR